jgi:hypothetical protein
MKSSLRNKKFQWPQESKYYQWEVVKKFKRRKRNIKCPWQAIQQEIKRFLTLFIYQEKKGRKH